MLWSIAGTICENHISCSEVRQPWTEIGCPNCLIRSLCNLVKLWTGNLQMPEREVAERLPGQPQFWYLEPHHLWYRKCMAGCMSRHIMLFRLRSDFMIVLVLGRVIELMLQDFRSQPIEQITSTFKLQTVWEKGWAWVTTGIWKMSHTDEQDDSDCKHLLNTQFVWNP